MPQRWAAAAAAGLIWNGRDLRAGSVQVAKMHGSAKGKEGVGDRYEGPHIWPCPSFSTYFFFEAMRDEKKEEGP